VRSVCGIACFVIVLTIPSSPAATFEGATSAATDVRVDFNGDGFNDLAIGVPYEDVGAVVDAGAVNVVYGSANGLVATGSSLWHQDSTGVAGAAETGDHFGASTAAGDFDGDGITDLAIGAPDESTGSVLDEGTVQVLRGTRSGLVAWRSWSILGVTGSSRTGDLCDCRFGAALAVGDYNGDGKADLAIGMPAKDLEYVNLLASPFPKTGIDAGAVAVLFGSTTGLAALGATIVAEGNDDSGAYQRNEIPDTLSLSNERFGAALVAGDHDGNGRDDLAIGAPGEEKVTVVFGSAGGIATAEPATYSWYLDDSTTDPRQRSSEFGSALAMGDLDADGRKELFVGAPFSDEGDAVDAGSVYELHSGGLVRRYTQRTLAGVAAETGDRFGASLAVGDFDRNGRADLAIGAPNEDIGSTADAGVVSVLSAFGSGLLDPLAAKTFSQGTAGIPGASEAGDRFGASLAACNLGRGLAVDLAIGVPLEDFTAGGVTHSNAGVIDVLYGVTGSGLSTTGVQDWSQASPGIAGGFETNDQFGYVLGR
jgi:hypothetical protein